MGFLSGSFLLVKLGPSLLPNDPRFASTPTPTRPEQRVQWGHLGLQQVKQETSVLAVWATQGTSWVGGGTSKNHPPHPTPRLIQFFSFL